MVRRLAVQNQKQTNGRTVVLSHLRQCFLKKCTLPLQLFMKYIEAKIMAHSCSILSCMLEAGIDLRHAGTGLKI